jgi:hypothetical protein
MFLSQQFRPCHGCRPPTTETSVHSRVSPYGIGGGQSGTRAGFPLSSLVFPVNIIPPWLFILIYHLEDEQYACWWPQFRNIVSPHWHEKVNNLRTAAALIIIFIYAFQEHSRQLQDPVHAGWRHRPVCCCASEPHVWNWLCRLHSNR